MMALDNLRQSVYSRGTMRDRSRPDLLRQLREEHLARAREAEAELLCEHLAAAGWSISAAAASLGCQVSSLQVALARHPEIDAARRAQGPDRGRPRKSA